MIRNAISSTKNVAFGTRKLLSSGTGPLATIAMCRSFSSRWRGGSSSGQHEDEQRHEREVDEEHCLDQTDRQEEDRLEAALGLGLPGHALDVRRTGETVTDTGADRTAAERQAAADEGAGQLDRVVTDGHLSPWFPRRGGGAFATSGRGPGPAPPAQCARAGSLLSSFSASAPVAVVEVLSWASCPSVCSSCSSWPTAAIP